MADATAALLYHTVAIMRSALIVSKDKVLRCHVAFLSLSFLRESMSCCFLNGTDAKFFTRVSKWLPRMSLALTGSSALG